jgi:hypothetical protein
LANVIKALLSYYDALYQEKFGARYPVTAKDCALAKRLLGLYSLEQLTGWIDRFFDTDDAWIKQTGYSFGVFSACLPKVIVMSTNQRELKRQQGSAWIQSIMRDREGKM